MHNKSLKELMYQASERELMDDHLSPEERKELVDKIRLAENIDEEVTDEDIYEDYIIM